MSGDSNTKNHQLFGGIVFNGEAPTVKYELLSVIDGKGVPVPGLFNAWITLDNPADYNSYTTEMVKLVTAAFSRASMDPTVVAVVFTAVGDKAFCTGGNTTEYAEHYSRRPSQYGEYMDLFIGMVDAILNCKKPVICRVNGMRIAGGQEIGMACDLTVSSDMATFGQAGPRHGSSPDGGSTDFLPWLLTIEQAMFSCIMCETWSAHKMERLGLITRAVRVLKDDGKFVINPMVYTAGYALDGVISYGEMLSGDEFKEAKKRAQSLTVDFTLLDAEVNAMCFKLMNLFPGCLGKAIDGIRGKKRFFWDQAKVASRHWLAANMNGEAWLGFTAFSERKLRGNVGVIDFAEFRRLIAAGAQFDEELAKAVLAPLVEVKP